MFLTITSSSSSFSSFPFALFSFIDRTESTERRKFSNSQILCCVRGANQNFQFMSPPKCMFGLIEMC